MDVDCSSLTYDTPASAPVLSAVEKATKEMAESPANLPVQPLDRLARKWLEMGSNLFRNNLETG